MNKEPLILITNDDGVSAEGLNHLIDSLKGLGKLVVFAPDGPRSGMSSAITSLVPVTYSLEREEENLAVYACSGTPVDCVKLAVHDLLKRPPDLLVSGINHGGNESVCVHYSGTMGAVIEGCIIGTPSLGVSIADFLPGASFSEAGRIAGIVAERILENGLPQGTYLNLNIPNRDRISGIAVCRQADGLWVNEFCDAQRPDGQAIFWLAGEFEQRPPCYPDSDVQKLREGCASLVPGRIDVTDYAFLETLRQWNLNI